MKIVELPPPNLFLCKEHFSLVNEKNTKIFATKTEMSKKELPLPCFA